METHKFAVVSLRERLAKGKTIPISVKQGDWQILSRIDGALRCDASWESRFSEMQAPLSDLSPDVNRWAIHTLRSDLSKAMLSDGYTSDEIEAMFGLYGLKPVQDATEAFRIPGINYGSGKS